MGTSAEDLLIVLDRTRPRSMRVQIEHGVRAAIRAGTLAPGSVVPSTRALAADLKVTRKVVVEAYDQLVAEGYLITRKGAATTVNQALSPVDRRPAAPTAAPDVEIDFRPGRPDLALFPRTAWTRASRAAMHTLPSAWLADDERRGLLHLRTGLAEHLRRVRGVDAHPDQIIVCAGFGHGLQLALAALVEQAGRRVAVEDPGYPAVRHQLSAAEIPFDPVAVDRHGLVVDDLRRSSARIAVVTPAHHSPTGVVLTPDRRRQLLDWARDVDGYVVEDDYDAEYRYDRRPVGALHGIAPDRVIYGGTTSKTLASGVRLGWIVVPRSLVEPIVALRRVTDGATSTILQATFAEFLAGGDLHRHLRRTRLAYRERRDTLVDELRRHLPGLEPSGIAAGLNVLVHLPRGTDEAAAVARALAAGVRVHPLAGFRAHPTADAPPGLVLGYATVRPAEIVRGVGLLAGALRDP